MVLSYSLPVCLNTKNRIRGGDTNKDNLKYDQLITRLDTPQLNSAFAINFITIIRRLKKEEVDLHIQKIRKKKHTDQFSVIFEISQKHDMHVYIIIIIIIIIHQELGLDRPVLALSLIVSSKVFQALFLVSCCYSFLLHVTDNFICIFLVSFQLVLLSTLPKFLHFFCGQKSITGFSSEKNSS